MCTPATHHPCTTWHCPETYAQLDDIALSGSYRCATLSVNHDEKPAHAPTPPVYRTYQLPSMSLPSFTPCVHDRIAPGKLSVHCPEMLMLMPAQNAHHHRPALIPTAYGRLNTQHHCSLPRSSTRAQAGVTEANAPFALHHTPADTLEATP